MGALVPGAELFAAGPLGTERYYNVISTKFELQAYYGILPYDRVANNPAGTAPVVLLAPNPAGETVDIELNNLEPGRYRMAIFDITGRPVFEKTAQINGPHTEQISLSQQAPGLYFFILFDENGSAVFRGKLVKH